MKNSTLSSKLYYLGYKSLEDYKKDGHWQRILENYRLSDLPNYCMICKDLDYKLYHTTYIRIGYEWLSDLIPLCEKCKNIIYSESKGQFHLVGDLRQILRKRFAHSRKQANEVVSEFSRFKEWPADPYHFELVNKIDK